MSKYVCMRREDALKVKVGDYVRPSPDWNRSERRKARQLPDPVMVREIDTEAVAQCGVMFKVMTLTAAELRLSAGWFLRPGEEQA